VAKGVVTAIAEGYRASSFSTYLASTSTSTFTPSPVSRPPSVVAESRDGEAHALDCDRPLLDDVTQELGSRVEAKAPSVTLGAGTSNGRDAVDVALDVVAAERFARTERRLEVDPRPGLEGRERRAVERLRHRLERE
jgi:hypothetical protein